MVEILLSLPIWIYITVALTVCATMLALCYSGIEFQVGKHVWVRIPGLRPRASPRRSELAQPTDRPAASAVRQPQTGASPAE